MASQSESTPFLADNEQGDNYEAEDHGARTASANSFFKRPIRILTALQSLLSIAAFGLLIATCVLIKIGPFRYPYSTLNYVRDLSICVCNPFEIFVYPISS
jgi:hypothetical protein